MEITSTPRIVTLLILSFALSGIAPIAYGQTSSALRIVSPVGGSTVMPGQIVRVVVTASNPATLNKIAVVGNGDIGSSSPQAVTATNTFNLMLPRDLAAGNYRLTAVASPQVNGKPASLVQSASVLIGVSDLGTVAAIEPQNGSVLTFKYPGQELPLLVTVKTTQGVETTIAPELLVYASSDPTIAAVNSVGVVTALTAGQARIDIAYNGSSSTVVDVRVGNPKAGDLNADGQVDIDDVNILNSFLNSPASNARDARDLNHDGKIDALDARILTTLCTYPRCGYR